MAQPTVRPDPDTEPHAEPGVVGPVDTASPGAETGAGLREITFDQTVPEPGIYAGEWGLLIQLLVIALAVGAALVAHDVVRRVLCRVSRRTRNRLDDLMVKPLVRPTRLLLPLIAVLFVTQAMSLGGIGVAFRHALSLAIIGAMAWVIIAALDALEAVVLSKYDVTAADNLRARSRHTQLRVLTRTVQIFIVVITIAVALMTFPRVRELGTSLLASAGIAGLALGLAARPLLESVLAGLQIALTEPIRLDDVVIVEGEWGRVEELTATYVVVKIWDERRLVVPLSWFLTNPFQNWTKTSSQLLGTAFLYLDYRAPVNAIRDELQRICEASPQWDKRVCVVQVTDAKNREIEIRLLVSAANSGALFDLRCQAREGVIAFLQREHPEALPTTRFEWHRPEEADARAAQSHDPSDTPGGGQTAPSPEREAPSTA